MSQAMIIEWVDIQTLQENKDNPRSISEEKFRALCKSLEEFPAMLELRPIIIKGNVVIGGNMRLKASAKVGLKKVPIIRADSFTEDQIRQFIVKDNLSLGIWDMDLLGSLYDYQELESWGFDFPEMGEMETLESLEAHEDDYEAPDEIKTDIKVGDIFQIGPHRLMCGDSTETADVERLMDGKKADMVFTDPPYNVASESKNYASDVSKAMKDLKESSWDHDFEIEPFLKNLQFIIKENCSIYIWTSQFLINKIWEFFKDADYSSYLVWSKPNPMPSLSKRHPTWNTELCAYITLGSKRIVNFPSSGHFLSCREVIKQSDGSHPTQKPINLISPLIEFNSNQGSEVIDLFLGSGSTMVACHQLKRVCFGMELEPKYCQVIIDRMKKLDPSIEVVKNP